jgi:hypothetical protein
MTDELMTNMMNCLIKRAQDLLQNAKEVARAFLQDKEDEEHLYQAIEDYSNENYVPDEVFEEFENGNPKEAATILLDFFGKYDAETEFDPINESFKEDYNKSLKDYPTWDEDEADDEDTFKKHMEDFGYSVHYQPKPKYVPSASSQFEQDKQSATSAALRLFKGKDVKLSLKIIFQFLRDYNLLKESKFETLKSLPPQDLSLAVIDFITDLEDPNPAFLKENPDTSWFEEKLQSHRAPNTEPDEPPTSYSLDSIDEDDTDTDTFEKDIKSIPIPTPEIEGNMDELPSFDDFYLSQETTKANPELFEALRKSMEKTNY